jgi:hypothetical protein
LFFIYPALKNYFHHNEVLVTDNKQSLGWESDIGGMWHGQNTTNTGGAAIPLLINIVFNKSLEKRTVDKAGCH